MSTERCSSVYDDCDTRTRRFCGGGAAGSQEACQGNIGALSLPAESTRTKRNGFCRGNNFSEKKHLKIAKTKFRSEKTAIQQRLDSLPKGGLERCKLSLQQDLNVTSSLQGMSLSYADGSGHLKSKVKYWRAIHEADTVAIITRTSRSNRVGRKGATALHARDLLKTKRHFGNRSARLQKLVLGM